MLMFSELEHFHFENALLTRKRQPPQRGVHSGENRVFRLNATFDFHKKSKVICSKTPPRFRRGSKHAPLNGERADTPGRVDEKRRHDKKHGERGQPQG
ncbi:hypothetical protein [Desulfovibrio sp. ZJ200]|uniref:hypothetical protein n=1 Tax=Desulfovibrio sp. ZJ200 TaxID=2709792 RepID=UPI001F14AD52|nr:hypothetical protein [Desulfovibrio sp. ZJ200]